MRLVILFLLLGYNNLYSQSIYTNIKGDTIPVEEIFPSNKKCIYVYISNKSCTGCKDNLNKYLLKIDTSKCKVVILSELSNNSNLLRRESRNYINNYFTKYNELFYIYSNENKITPYLILLNNNRNFLVSYKTLFDETKLSQYAIEELNNFLIN